MKTTNNPFGVYDAMPRARGRVPMYPGKHWGVDAVQWEGDPLESIRSAAAKQRFLAFTIFALLITAIFAGRLWQLQISQGSTLRVAAEENRIRLKPIHASRGVLYDRNGALLLRNVPNLSLEMVPADLPAGDTLRAEATGIALLLREEPEAFLTEIEKLLADDVRRYRSYTYKPRTVREHLSYDVAQQLLLRERDLPGFHVETTAMREYLAGAAFSQVLGYTGRVTEEEIQKNSEHPYTPTDDVGKLGLERAYEQTLRGRDGTKQVEVDALGKELRVVASEPPVPGNDLTLSIDVGLQRQAQEALEASMAGHDATGGAAVAVDPRSGEILALATAPTFENNLFTAGLSREAYETLVQDERRPLFNRATGGQYPPGSTIKPLIASAALQEGVVTAATTILSTGGIGIGRWFFPDWKAGGHGSTDVKKAIAQSVNTYFYTVGGGTETFTGLGVARIARYLGLFGLGSPTTIDFDTEAKGFVPSPAWKEQAKKERWYVGDTYHLAIGQGDVLVTPLQMAMATAAIANGGALYQPHLVRSVAAPGGEPAAIGPTIRRQDFVAPEHLKAVREGMREAVISGSARALQSLPVPAAGKTGTAQFGTKKRTHAWFISFAPFENPEIAIAVILEGGGQGHEAALPVAKQMLQWYFSASR